MGSREGFRSEPFFLATESCAASRVVAVRGPGQIVLGGIQLLQQPLRDKLQAIEGEFSIEDRGEWEGHLCTFKDLST